MFTTAARKRLSNCLEVSCVLVTSTDHVCQYPRERDYSSPGEYSSVDIMTASSR